MVKKLGFGLENLVIKKIPRRLLFIGSALFIGFGHGSGMARTRALLRLGNGSCRFGIGSGVVGIGSDAGCTRDGREFWSLAEDCRVAFRRAPGVHRRCSGKCGRDQACPGWCPGNFDGAQAFWIAAEVLLGHGRDRLGSSRWCPGILGSRPTCVRGVPMVSGRLPMELVQAFYRTPGVRVLYLFYFLF